MDLKDLEEFLDENPNGILFISSNNLNDSIIEGYLNELNLIHKKVNIINLNPKFMRHLNVGIGINLYFFKNKEVKIYIGGLMSFENFKETLKELDSF